jgi:hypothetical protein
MFISTSKNIHETIEHTQVAGCNCFGCRFDELDTSPITWHIDATAGMKDGDENYPAITNYIVMPEPWQSAVNGLY